MNLYQVVYTYNDRQDIESEAVVAESALEAELLVEKMLIEALGVVFDTSDLLDAYIVEEAFDSKGRKYKVELKEVTDNETNRKTKK